jgi:hypothetical protein
MSEIKENIKDTNKIMKKVFNKLYRPAYARDKYMAHRAEQIKKFGF